MFRVNDGDNNRDWWLQTQIWTVGLIGWLSIELEQMNRIREINLANSRPVNIVFTNWDGITCNGAFLTVGTLPDAS